MKVTGTDVVWPLPVTTTIPLYVPAARPVRVEETVNVAGVVPVAGVTLSQEAPLTDAV